MPTVAGSDPSQSPSRDVSPEPRSSSPVSPKTPAQTPAPLVESTSPHPTSPKPIVDPSTPSPDSPLEPVKPLPEVAKPVSEPKTSVETEPASLPLIDMDTFQQILELDEDDNVEFSQGMTWAYFTQADKAFKDMDTALATKNLPELSSLGHFLKGSSAALGVSKVQEACEKIQHYGLLRDEEANEDLTPTVALGKIEQLLGTVKTDYSLAAEWLRKWYSKDSTE